MATKLYSGTPGSGKSFHAAKDIKMKLLSRKNVISTMGVDLNVINKNGKKKTGKYVFMLIQELTPKYLIEFAFQNHRIGKEGQTLLVIDECQILFNPREYNNKTRMEWILFFSYHRHYGYDIILITQFDRLIDRQIRGQVEHEFKHRKINNRGLFFLLPIKVFAVIEYWYVNKTKLGSYFVPFSKSVSRIYDSYVMNDVIAEKLGAQINSDEDIPIPETGLDLSRDGVRGSPSRRRKGRILEWWTINMRTADVK